jgi:hypothetical protein
MMVAFKRHEDLYWFRPEHYVNLRDDQVRVPRLNALKFLEWGCKNGGRGRRARARRWTARRKASEALLWCGKNEFKMDALAAHI